MKLQSFALILLALASTALAETKVTLSGVHNCCKKCTDGITKAVGSVNGTNATVEKTSVTITGTSAAEVQKAVDALVAAGYTGESDNAEVKVKPGAGADEKVSALTVSGVHLCCGKCVTAAQKAIQTVSGVKSDNATKGAESFKVEGDFNAKELMAALAKAGFTGTASK